MHKILLRVVGKSHEGWHPQAIHMYLERLSPFAKVEIVELEEGRDVDAKLFKGIPENATIVVCDSRGKEFTSDVFAKKLEEWTEFGKPVAFVLGGSEGIQSSTIPVQAIKLSFGALTLPHVLARIVLLEQLYRAETILAGKRYHK